ncbi:hypothetical protein KEJ50_04930 [Candidatus Bathyarchaeota archaeon]|nr:hypothetical protein [Candidatus Bathyarchaeota archaeon]
MKALDLIGAEAANMDLIVKLRKFPKPEEEVKTKKLCIHGGGFTANIIVGASSYTLGWKLKIGVDKDA